MAVTKEKKSEVLKELIDNMKEAKSVVFADFQGLSVKDMKTLRKDMRAKGVNYKVAKKTLISIAAKEAGYPEIPDNILVGPIGAAFSMEDEVSAAKLIHQFAKKNENLKLRGAILEGRILTLVETLALANLPGREELLSKFVYLVKYPIQGFHGVLNNTLAGFVRVLNAVREKNEQTA